MELDQFRDVDLVIDRANDSFVQKQFVSQGDYKGRSLTVQVTNNGSVGEVPGLTLNLRWHNEASGLTDLSAFSVVDKSNSIFRIEYPQNMLTPGKVFASVQILQNGKTTQLKEFELTVQQLAGQTVGIAQQAEFSALVAVLADSNKFRTDINSLNSTKADKSFVDAQLSSIVSGAPAATFSTLDALKAAYPSGTSGVMLVLNNGHWYYWNSSSSQWTDGGVYQASKISDGSVSGRHIVNSSISAKDTNFLTDSTNIFDKEKRTINKYLGLDGTVSDSTTYDVSNFIAIDSDYLYFSPLADNGVFRDKNGVFISSFKSINPIIVPENAVFLQFSLKKENVAIQQVNAGQTKLDYARSHQRLNTSVKVDKDSIIYKSIDHTKLADLTVEVTSKNLFNPKNVVYGYFEYLSGQFVSSTTLRSIKIDNVKPGVKYSKNIAPGWDITFWDEYDKFVSGLNTNGQLNFTVPDNPAIHSMRIVIPTSANINDYVVKEGDYVAGFYDEYAEKVYFKGIEISKISEAESKDNAKSRADVNLFIETYFEGGNQPYHPSVVSFSEPWNYYKYWMAYTPLPFGDEDNENPCIAVSNDMIKWLTRPAQNNPIDNLSDGTQTYWSDTELVYNNDLNQLECWYRGYNSTENKVTICRKVSTDGTTWGSREILKVFTATSGYVSPSVIYEGGTYKIWLLEPGVYYETSDLNNWGAAKTYTLSNKRWHGQVKKVDGKYIYITSGVYGEGTIDYYTSTDETNFSYVSSIIKSTKVLGYTNLASVDGIGFYRPCFIYENGKYYVFYSTVANDNSRGVTLSYGDDLEDLKGIDATHINKMSKPTRKSFYGLESMIFDKTDNSLNFCVNPSTTKKVQAEWIKL